MFLTKQVNSSKKEEENILSRLQLARAERQKIIRQENDPLFKQQQATELEAQKHVGLSKRQYKKYVHSRTELTTKNASNLFQNFVNFKKHKFDAFGNVSHICAHPTNPNQWLYTCGQAAQMHYVDEFTKKVKIYKMPKLAQTAASAVFRKDASVFGVGGFCPSKPMNKQGVVAIYRGIESARATVPLRLFYSHKYAVSSVHFPDEAHVLSASTDVHYHLLSQTHSDQPLTVLKHDDYTTSVSSISDKLVVTGCADHYVRVWDLRQQPVKSVRSWKMDTAVRSVGVIGSGKVVGAGEGISVWDIGYEEMIWGGDEVNCVSCRGDSIIAGSLDGSVRVWGANNGDLRFEKTFEKSVLAVDLSIDDKRMFVATADKLLLKSVREDSFVSKREDSEEKVTNDNFKTLVSPLIIQNELNRETRSAALDKFSKQLGGFNYKAALDLAVTNYKEKPELGVALITELMSRNELLNALDARNEAELAPILQFLAEYATDIRFYRVLIPVANHVIAIYAETIGQSPNCDRLWKSLKAKVRDELDSLRSAAKIRGVLDLLIRSNAHQ